MLRNGKAFLNDITSKNELVLILIKFQSWHDGRPDGIIYDLKWPWWSLIFISWFGTSTFLLGYLFKISIPFRILSLSFPITVHSRWPLDDLPMTSDITLKNQTWFSWYYVVFHIVSLTIELSCTRSGNVPNRTITKTRSRFWGTNQNQKKRILKICDEFEASHFSVLKNITLLTANVTDCY